MSTQVKGVSLTGVKIDGAVFLNPQELSAAYWLRRSTGVSGSTSVAQWDDSSGSGRHFIQHASSGARPAYNSSTGVVSFDGTSDWLRNNTNAPNGNVGGEIVMVMSWASGDTGIIHSQRINVTVDADARKVNINVNKFGFVMNESGTNSWSSTNSYIPDTWYILSIARPSRNHLYINGVLQSVTNNTSFTWQPLNPIYASHLIGAEHRNSTMTGNEQAPINHAKFKLVDCAFFTSPLTEVQRIKLVNYYRFAYSDLNLQ